MENVQNDNAKKHHQTLCVPTREWEKRQKILTENDDKAAIKKVKRIKNKQQAGSQVIADSFNNTILNNRRKELEKKQKLLAEIEAKQIEKDNQIKQEILERRNKIVEKALENKWLAKDSTKTVNRKEQIMQVLKERDIQIEFNKAEKAKLMEENRLLMIEQNKEAEQYIKDQWEQKIKKAETKKSNAASYLELLKDRENKRRDENAKLIKEGKTEIQRVMNEIEKHNEIERDKIQKIKENTFKNLKESQEIVSKNKELRRLEEQDENEIIAILAESKKTITKAIKLKEIEILKKRFELSNQIMEKTIQIQAKKKNVSDIAFQKAIKEKERQYQEERLRKEELARKRKEDFEEYKKRLDKENQKEKERLALSRQWELDRRIRETVVLNDLENLHRQAIIDEKKHFREDLDAQCANNRAASLADKREDQKHYYELINLWRQEDEKFLTYTRNLIDKYKKAGKSVVPFLKAIKDYVEKNKLLADAINTNYKVDS